MISCLRLSRFEHSISIQNSILKATQTISLARFLSITFNKFIDLDSGNDQGKTERCTFSNPVHLDLRFNVIEDKDAALSNVRKLIIREKNSRTRRQSDVIVLEGVRLINDALLDGAIPKCLCFCKPSVLMHLEESSKHLLRDVSLYHISAETMNAFSDTVTPAGLLGVFMKPEQGEAVSAAQSSLPFTLIFDGLKDPGNAGTLIRTAAAVGCSRVLATAGCVNLWERKVLRSAMGAHFHLPIITEVDWVDVHNHLTDHTQVILATSQSSQEPDEDAAVLKQRHRQCEQINSADIVPFYSYTELPIKSSAGSTLGDSGISSLNIPVEVALVIGGEANGLSTHAKMFAAQNQGVYVTIPMAGVVNSLNSAIAGSIIMYEIRKKLLELI